MVLTRETARRPALAGVAGLLLAALPTPAASAASVSYSTPASAGVTVNDLTGFMTTGADMAGMRVTATFAGGATQSLAWTASDASSGGVVGAGWSVSESGDTYDAPAGSGVWTLVAGANSPISSLLFEGAPTNPTGGPTATGTVFDRLLPDFGTGGSFRGSDLTSDAPALALRVSYLNPVDNLADGPGALEDLYATMRVDFADPSSFTGTFVFRQDTDTIGPRRPDIPPGPENPEPTGLAFAGVAALLLRRVRR